MTGVFIKRENLDTETYTHREDGVKRPRGKMSIYKSRRESRSRSFLTTLRKKPIRLTP